MKTSARNELNGKITEIKNGAVMSEVVVKVNDKVEILSTITHQSTKNLDVKTGDNVTLLIKSSLVILSKEKLQATARNNIPATVKEVQKGAINGEVKLALDDTTLYSVVTNEAIDDLDIKVGDTVYAIFKASSVIFVK